MADAALIKAMADAGCTGQQIAAVIQFISETENEKLLARRAAGRQRQRRYMEKLKQNQQSTDDHCASVTVSDASTPLPPCPPSDKKDTPTPLEKINSPLNPPTPHVFREQKTDFDRFYGAYPHKVGKKAAAKAWSSAQKRAPFEQIMAGLHRYIATKPPDRPWCNPATWLNQDRWEDEPINIQLSAKIDIRRRTIHDQVDELRAALAAENQSSDSNPLARGLVEIIPPDHRTYPGEVAGNGGGFHQLSGKPPEGDLPPNIWDGYQF